MGRTYRTGLLAGFSAALLTVIVLATLAVLIDRAGLFADKPERIPLNGLNVDFALCPPTLTVAAGTDLSRACREPVAGLDARISSGARTVHLSSVGDELAVDDLPNGAIRLRIDGVAPGTVDVLSCRSYAQDEAGRFSVMSLVPPIAYGAEPMTASIIAQPWVVTGWPANRWQVIPADPTTEQVAAQPSTYGTVFRCTWFLLPPGSIVDRPGIVRSWTATDTLGEPAIHVLTPGSGGDDSSAIATTGETPAGNAFVFRSTLDGSVITTGDSSIDHYLLPAGSWAVTDQAADRQAIVDLAPGQTTRVVSITAIISPPTATPLP